MGAVDRCPRPAPDEDACEPLTAAEQEALACLGEGWADGGAALEQIKGEPCGYLLTWLLSAGAAGVLAGGVWWREMLARKHEPVARPEQIQAAVDQFGRQVDEIATITISMQAGLSRLRDRQRRILELIDQSCTKRTR